MYDVRVNQINCAPIGSDKTWLYDWDGVQFPYGGAATFYNWGNFVIHTDDGQIAINCKCQNLYLGTPGTATFDISGTKFDVWVAYLNGPAWALRVKCRDVTKEFWVTWSGNAGAHGSQDIYSSNVYSIDFKGDVTGSSYRVWARHKVRNGMQDTTCQSLVVIPEVAPYLSLTDTPTLITAWDALHETGSTSRFKGGVSLVNYYCVDYQVSQFYSPLMLVEVDSTLRDSNEAPGTLWTTSAYLGSPAPNISKVNFINDFKPYSVTDKVKMSGENISTGVIVGKVYIQTKPVSKRVAVLDRANFKLMAITRSDSQGNYKVSGLPPNKKYVVLGLDDDLIYDGVAHDYVGAV